MFVASSEFWLVPVLDLIPLNVSEEGLPLLNLSKQKQQLVQRLSLDFLLPKSKQMRPFMSIKDGTELNLHFDLHFLSQYTVYVFMIIMFLKMF